MQTLCRACRGPCTAPGADHAAFAVEVDERCALHGCLLPRRFHDALASPPHRGRFVRWAAVTAPLARQLDAWPALASLSSAFAQARGAGDMAAALRFYGARAAAEDGLLRQLVPVPAPDPGPGPEPGPGPGREVEPEPEPEPDHVQDQEVQKDKEKDAPKKGAVANVGVALGIVVAVGGVLAACLVAAKR